MMSSQKLSSRAIVAARPLGPGRESIIVLGIDHSALDNQQPRDLCKAFAEVASLRK